MNTLIYIYKTRTHNETILHCHCEQCRKSPWSILRRDKTQNRWHKFSFFLDTNLVISNLHRNYCVVFAFSISCWVFFSPKFPIISETQSIIVWNERCFKMLKYLHQRSRIAIVNGVFFLLFYSRTLAKSLIAKNEMLHHRIEALESRRPPMSKSPMLNALMHKYHEEN